MKINPYRLGMLFPLLTQVELTEHGFNVVRSTLGRFTYKEEFEQCVEFSRTHPNSDSRLYMQPFELVNFSGKMFLLSREVLDWLTSHDDVTGQPLPALNFKKCFETPYLVACRLNLWGLLNVMDPSFHNQVVRRKIRFAKTDDAGIMVLKAGDTRREYITHFKFKEEDQEQ